MSSLRFLSLVGMLFLYTSSISHGAPAGDAGTTGSTEKKVNVSKTLNHIKADLKQLRKTAKDSLQLKPQASQNLKITAGNERITIYYNDDDWNVIGICEDPPGYCPC